MRSEFGVVPLVPESFRLIRLDIELASVGFIKLATRIASIVTQISRCMLLIFVSKE